MGIVGLLLVLAHTGPGRLKPTSFVQFLLALQAPRHRSAGVQGQGAVAAVQTLGCSAAACAGRCSYILSLTHPLSPSCSSIACLRPRLIIRTPDEHCPDLSVQLPILLDSPLSFFHSLAHRLIGDRTTVVATITTATTTQRRRHHRTSPVFGSSFFLPLSLSVSLALTFTRSRPYLAPPPSQATLLG